MTTLAETLKQQPLNRVIEKYSREVTDLGLKASVTTRWLSSDEFLLMRVPLSRLAIHYGEICASEETPKGLVVIDINKNKIGRTSGGYLPKAVIVAGAEIVRFAKAKDANFLNCWVGRKAFKALELTIQADHMIGTTELNRELSKLLKSKYAQGYAYIVEIYPFEGYFIYSYDSEQYRQTFKCDITSRKVSLDGSPVKVFTQYKSATELKAGAGGVDNHQESYVTGDMEPSIKRNRSMVPSRISDYTDFGPTSNFLNNPQLYDDSDVEDTLDVYLHNLKDGIWKPVSSHWAPVPTQYQAVANRFKASADKHKLSIVPMDVINWYRYQIKAAENVGVNNTANPAESADNMGAKKAKKKKK